MHQLYVVPGAVSNLKGEPKFISIVLTWSAPREPNGVIISYEVTYGVNDSTKANTTALSTAFTISSLTPGTGVPNITVSAYTSVGRGAAAVLAYLDTLTTPRESCMHANYCCPTVVCV